MNPEPDLSARTLTLTRIFDAPPGKVYRAWTELRTQIISLPPIDRRTIIPLLLLWITIPIAAIRRPTSPLSEGVNFCSAVQRELHLAY